MAEKSGFAKWLTEERKSRELKYVISMNLTKLKSNFSYSRIEGVVFMLVCLCRCN